MDRARAMGSIKFSIKFYLIVVKGKNALIHYFHKFKHWYNVSQSFFQAKYLSYLKLNYSVPLTFEFNT